MHCELVGSRLCRFSSFAVHAILRTASGKHAAFPTTFRFSSVHQGAPWSLNVNHDASLVIFGLAKPNRIGSFPVFSAESCDTLSEWSRLLAMWKGGFTLSGGTLSLIRPCAIADKYTVVRHGFQLVPPARDLPVQSPAPSVEQPVKSPRRFCCQFTPSRIGRAVGPHKHSSVRKIPKATTLPGDFQDLPAASFFAARASVLRAFSALMCANAWARLQSLQ